LKRADVNESSKGHNVLSVERAYILPAAQLRAERIPVAPPLPLLLEAKTIDLEADVNILLNPIDGRGMDEGSMSIMECLEAEREGIRMRKRREVKKKILVRRMTVMSLMLWLQCLDLEGLEVPR
jgi:hypothetical protein